MEDKGPDSAKGFSHIICAQQLVHSALYTQADGVVAGVALVGHGVYLALYYKEEEVSASAQGLAPEETAETSQEQTGTVKNDMTYTDERSLLDDSERLMIYESIIPTMEQEPLRLLRGCLCEDVMEISNQVMPKTKPHFHNSYLQAFNITGLPGLGLLLVVKIVRLFFSSAPMEQKVLLMILTGIFSYNLLETSLFVAADTRAFIFYIIAGAVLACYQDRFPKAAAEGTA